MATLDVLLLADAKEAVGLPTAADVDIDGSMAALVTAVSVALDQLCGPIVQRIVTGALYDGGGGRRLRPLGVDLVSTYALLSVQSLTEYVGTVATVLTAETNTTKPAQGYLLYPKEALIVRRQSGADARFAAGRQNLSLDYTAGRFVDTDAVDKPFLEAAKVMFAHIWRSERGAGGEIFGPGSGVLASGVPAFAVPAAAKGLLGVEARLPGLA